MSNNDAQTILVIVGLIASLGVLFSFFAAFFGYVFYQSSKRKRIVKKMLSTHQELVGNRRWFPARYASATRFKSWFKIFPWEGAGILVLAPGSTLFLGETNSGVPVSMQFALANSRLNWIGKSPFPNGAVSWFEFTLADRKEYFSSETGTFVFGSHRTTKELFDEANKSFAGG